MIECQKCQHDNDLGRIFCAKCGEKLDITHVGPPSGVKRRIKSGKKSLSLAKIASTIATQCVKVFFLAIMAAIVTLIWLPPDLQRKGFDEKNIEAYQTKLDQMETGEQNARIIFEEGDLNAIMAQAVQKIRKENEGAKGLVLSSVYFSLREGLVVVTAEQKWKWFRLTAQLEAKPVQNDAGWSFAPMGARIGRFMAAPHFGGKGPDVIMLAKVSDAFQKLLSGLETEKRLLERISGITIRPGQIILTLKDA